MKKHVKPPKVIRPPKPPKPEPVEEPPEPVLPPLPELPKNIDDMKEQLNQIDKEIHMLRSKLANKQFTEYYKDYCIQTVYMDSYKTMLPPPHLQYFEIRLASKGYLLDGANFLNKWKLYYKSFLFNPAPKTRKESGAVRFQVS